jgi:predicted transcriptional regulator
MGYQATSGYALSNIKDIHLAEKQEEVLRVLGYGPYCNQEISRLLGWPINTVTPRVKELRELGKVEESHRAKYFLTGRTVIFWRVAC